MAAGSVALFASCSGPTEPWVVQRWTLDATYDPVTFATDTVGSYIVLGDTVELRDDGSITHSLWARDLSSADSAVEHFRLRHGHFDQSDAQHLSGVDTLYGRFVSQLYNEITIYGDSTGMMHRRAMWFYSVAR
ncbi:MAG TPA: hypothetical protein VJU80_03640 [Solirubrobacteraceae bacterium]|nr:hypothetical protein [Solirubrobacteraceae bacterium]